MVFHMFTYITADNITVYEVSQGSISSNLEYNALAIRDETIVNAESNGDILYLAENLGRVGVKSNIYALDTSGKLLSSLTDESNSDIKLDASSYSKLQSLVSSFSTSYNDMSFSKVYSFKSDMESQLAQLYNITAMDSMEGQVQTAIDSGTFSIYNSQQPGVVVFGTDGYESITTDDFTAENLDSSKYSYTNLKSQESVVAGQPVYKLITSDDWNLVCEINESLYETLSEDTYVRVQFLADDTITWATMEFKQAAGKYYLILGLDDSMEKFADSRFVHIKLITSNISGLKIPNSSIVEKEFFTIPKSYFYQGNNDTEQGFMVKKGSSTEFVTPTIYYETDDYYYIDGEDVSRGDQIVSSGAGDSYVVGSDLAKLEGVYNVNKGYSVFKQIEILYQNNDYSIIKTGTDYGIAMYDHIVLQGDEVEENTIIN
ncbi:MAG: hypothetical protein K6E79_00895 [Pseudobutyrivibrio sp.]|nr:hypothetical protein [Pseudobutyrivibrio sp.]